MDNKLKKKKEDDLKKMEDNLKQKWKKGWTITHHLNF
jgi:hypothetical protein